MKYRQGTPITKPKLLVGEGVDEVYFFSALVNDLEIDDIQVDQYGGKHKLREGLDALMKRSGFKNNVVSLGITRDADYPNDPAADEMMAAPSAFQSVCSALTSLGLPVPPAVGVKEAGPVSVSVFILPGGDKPGMLEDLCLASADADSAFECVVEFFDCVEQRGGQSHARNMAAKARVHAWLATKPEPDKRLGEAGQSEYWDFSDEAFSDLKSFIQNL